MEVVVGIPAYNEAKNIGAIILKLKKIVDKIIVCNDGSSDLTSEIAESLGAIVINHTKNLGYGSAIRSLLMKGIDVRSDILVTFDADGQHRPEDIKAVLEPIMKNEADIVIGSRFLSDDDKDTPRYRKAGIKAITNITNISIDTKLTDSQSGFRAYSKRVLKDIIPSERGMGVSTEILIKASNKGYRIREVPIKILYEGKTSTHHPVSHGVSVIFSTIKFISIEHPLKFYGVPGTIFLAIGLFFAIWIAQYYAEFRAFPPVLALIAIGTTLFGLMFLMMAIILYSLISVVREGKNN